MLPQGQGWLLVEFGGSSRAEAVAGAQRLMAELARREDAPQMRLYRDDDEASQQYVV